LVGFAQLVQACFLRGVADVTPLVLAVAAWLIGIRCWRAFVPQRVLPGEYAAHTPATLAGQ
jgi:hypothetical protein